MVLASAQLRARPERKDGGHPALCNAPPQWLRMRHQSHQSHPLDDIDRVFRSPMPVPLKSKFNSVPTNTIYLVIDRK